MENLGMDLAWFKNGRGKRRGSTVSFIGQAGALRGRTLV